MLKVAILTIGDEILIGQIINTNAAWISEKISGLGAHIWKHSAVGDNREVMLSEIDRLFKESDVLIISGGLGPTHDDITKAVLAEYFNDKLISDPTTYAYLQDLFKFKERDFNELAQSQAIVPSTATTLKNEVGTAPGLMFEKNNKFLFALPGVPNEMKFIMRNSILPKIEEIINFRDHKVMMYRTIHTTGVPESDLAALIGDPKLLWQEGQLAYLPSYWGVRLRISCNAVTHKAGLQQIETMEKRLNEKAGKYIIGKETETVDSAVSKLLAKKELTISVAESCTGGLLGGAFTERPGSSGYFQGGVIAYSNEVKNRQLDVKQETLDTHGAVSEQTAIELAANVRTKFNTDFGISITGVAGPAGGTKEKPVGTVWIGLASKDGVIAKKYVFSKDRRTNRELSVGYAFSMLYEKLKELDED